MFSRSWTESNENEHITTKELLTLVEAVKIWRHYLYARQFYFHSDSKILEYLWERKRKKKLKSTKQHQHLQQMVPDISKPGALPFDSECDRDVAMLSIKHAKQYLHFAKDRSYEKWRNVMPQEMDIMEVARSISYKSERCFMQRLHRKEHKLYKTTSKTNPNKAKQDYVNEKHERPPTHEIVKRKGGWNNGKGMGIGSIWRIQKA